MVLKNAAKQRQKRIIVLEDLDFLWDELELERSRSSVENWKRR
ncbi:hypothetical protein MKX67_08820 [Cytobacillus sp. FSL W7-1323]